MTSDAFIVPMWSSHGTSTAAKGCGSLSPRTPKPAPTWTCNICGEGDHESEQDADECCGVAYILGQALDCGHRDMGLRCPHCTAPMCGEYGPDAAEQCPSAEEHSNCIHTL